MLSDNVTVWQNVRVWQMVVIMIMVWQMVSLILQDVNSVSEDIVKLVALKVPHYIMLR
jgi:hypothetical protein